MTLAHTITILPLILFLLICVNAVTNPNDFKILKDFRNGLENPDLLRWPKHGGDPCGPPVWPHIDCSNGRVTAIQVRGLGLKGPLPRNLNQLTELKNVGFQKNFFNGELPSFSGLSNLQYAYLDSNEFDTIPFDFFNGLSNVMVLALDSNPLNRSTGWTIPGDLAKCTRLVNFSCSFCNIYGQVPEFFGEFSSLKSLKLSSNSLSGGIPSSFDGSLMQVLWLNDQVGGGMNGSISVISSMVLLTQLWLHGNQFTGPIPDSIASLTSLKELNVNNNLLVGLIPPGLSTLNLQSLDLGNNLFMGPVPKFNAASINYKSNSFCQNVPGVDCDPSVNALLDFLRLVDYPIRLAVVWKGNNPCAETWSGISCNPRNEVSVINMKDLGLHGTVSPSISSLSSLVEIHLEGNHLEGRLPESLTLLRSLKLLDLTGNRFELPLPTFSSNVKVMYDPATSSQVSSLGPSSGYEQDVTTTRFKAILISAVCAVGVLILFAPLAVFVVILCHERRRNIKNASQKAKMEAFAMEGGSEIRTINSLMNAQVIEASGSLVFSFEVLRQVTNNFSRENILGRGGFGVVYRGILEDGTMLAVKRMEAGAISNKGISEFQTEISVLSSVRHRHLVSLLGYSCEGNEKLLVYEYMPQGALSKHLFHWRAMSLDPLSWPTRLNIALDVARGVEYLHSMAQHSFIHRDLKSSNILLDHDFRAKVSDFGLVKLARDTGMSFATRLAGTFGYLAPEYAGMNLDQTLFRKIRSG